MNAMTLREILQDIPEVAMKILVRLHGPEKVKQILEDAIKEVENVA